MARVLLYKTRPYANLYSEVAQESARIRNEATRIDVKESHAMAIGYAWGRQDAGESATDSHAAWLFGHAYALHAALYATEARHSRKPLVDAYAEWIAAGVIA